MITQLERERGREMNREINVAVVCCATLFITMKVHN